MSSHSAESSSSNSSDSEEMEEMDDDEANLDKDDDNIEFQNKINENKPNNKYKTKQFKSIFSPQFRVIIPLTRKRLRKTSFNTSSSSSSDEFNRKIKNDLAEILNDKLTNFEKCQAKSQKEIFEKNFQTLQDDFKIIEEYEQKILKDTNIDIMFIMDLTTSMEAFLSEAKHNIKKITEEIWDTNPGAKIRLSFIGYRDFNCKGDKRDYEIINFTDNIDKFIWEIKKLECYGGEDQPEDIAGALNEALKLDWKSNAKYIVLVSDAPCHGNKYHDINIEDNFSEGDPDGLIIEDLILQIKKLDITFYCVEINETTKIMFDIMKNIYNDPNKFSIEQIGNTAENLSFFVAFSASELLGNKKYENCSFVEILNKLRKDSIDKIMKKYNKNNYIIENNNNNKESRDEEEDSITQSLIKQIDNLTLDGEDKKIIEFINRINNLNISNKNISNDEKKSDNNNNYINIAISEDFFLENQGASVNFKIYGLTYNKKNIRGINSFISPIIKEQIFDTNITIIYGYSLQKKEKENEYNYFLFYDNKLHKEMKGIIPKKIDKESFNDITLLTKKYCLEDLICEQISDIFNILIRSQSKQFIKFRKNVIYKQVEQIKDKNNIIIISDIALPFPEAISEIPTKKILQAFSHFSYQISYGELIIMNLNLNEKERKVTDYEMYYLKDKDGYKKILEFFSTHACNDICKYLELINPRKKNKKNKKNEINEPFFSKKFVLNYNLCKCCSIPIRKNINENYCCKCICEKIKSKSL